MNNQTGPEIGKNVYLNRSSFLRGEFGSTGTDGIVASNDMKEICTNINSTNKIYGKFPNRFHSGPFGIADASTLKELIRRLLKGEQITGRESGFELLSNQQSCAQQ